MFEKYDVLFEKNIDHVTDVKSLNHLLFAYFSGTQ